ncbi:tea1 [Symbiodinium natans]|uniref:Tea1 protein n=1 Tax=Symbiodinium natans TaxID=878477 RepID=A0A812PN52_9DINO|nr:tea1 [Symbiodinium natans]
MAAGEGQLYLFGGAALAEGPGGDHHETSELWRYDTAEALWTVVRASRPPAPRLGHGVVWLPENSSVLVFGGRTAACVLSDLWRWQAEPETDSWVRLHSTGPGPTARFGQAMLRHPTENAFWLHGGAGGAEGHGHGQGLHDDLWLCRMGPGPLEALWQRIHDAGGPRPQARALHALAYGTGNLWMHGGYGGEDLGRPLDDTWFFNLEEGLWSELQPGPPRQGHIAFYAGDAFWIYGSSGSSMVADMFHYDALRDRWSSVAAGAGFLPAQRTAHAAAYAEGTLWLHGGTPADNRSQSLGDLWAWQAASGDWHLESEYDTLEMQNLRHFAGGLALSSGSFLLALMVPFCCLQLRGRRRVLGCGLCRPLGWNPRRWALFAGGATFTMLAWSLGVMTAMAFAQWLASPDRTGIPLSFLLGAAGSASAAAAFGAASGVLLCFFACAVAPRMQGSYEPMEDPMHLALALLDADIKLVRLEFLRELHESHGLWPRRQEAERLRTRSGRPALLSHSEVVNWARAMCADPKQQRVISLSHMWEATGHPDPYGFQLSELVCLLEDAWRRDSRMILGVFIDFMSLYQSRQSKKHEEKAFQDAMRSMHLLYTHDWTYTVCVTSLTPPASKAGRRPSRLHVYCEAPHSDGPGLQWCEPSSLNHNSAEYLQRGWCLAELQWSSLRSSMKFGHVLGTTSFKSQHLLQRAPKGPAMFRRELAKSAFTHRSDFSFLAAAQQMVFEEKARDAQALELEGLPEAEIEILADSLQSYQALEQLQLSRCAIGVQGFALRLTWVQSLRKVALQECAIADADLPPLLEALTPSCPWLSLDLSLNFVGDAGAASLSRALAKKPRLKELVLKNNCIEDAGATALFEAWVSLHNQEAPASSCSSAALLDMAEGAVLTRWRKDGLIGLGKLDLQYNLLTRKGIRDLEGRSRQEGWSRPGTTLLVAVQKERRALAKAGWAATQVQEEPSTHPPSPSMPETADEVGEVRSQEVVTADEEAAILHSEPAEGTGEVEEAPFVRLSSLASSGSALAGAPVEPDTDLQQIDVKMLMEEELPFFNPPEEEMGSDLAGPPPQGPPCWAPFDCNKPGACQLHL